MKRFLLFLTVALAVSSVCPQSFPPIGFTHIGLKNGLSQSTVFDIVQDKSGNLWFATYDGLNRYNGYDFTIYRHDDTDAYSLPSDIVRTLNTDSKGRLWIGTDEGLSLYLPDEECFLNYRTDSLNPAPVGNIEESGEDELMVVAQNRSLLFDVRTRSFSETRLPGTLRTLPVTALKRHGGSLYVGTHGQGIFVYSIAEGTLRPMPLPQTEGTDILAFLPQSPNRLWIATEGKGLFCYDLSNGKSTNYRRGDGSGLSSDFVRTLVLDAQNRLWVGTVNALNIYDEASDRFADYDHNPARPESLSQTSVRSLFVDSQEGVWVGTYFGGVNYYHPLKMRFLDMPLTSETNPPGDKVIECIVEDAGGDLWIGTNNGGVSHYDARSGRFTRYTKADGLRSNNIKAIFPDGRNGQVYIGTHTGGLSVLNRNTGRIETYNTELRNVYALLPAADGRIWMSHLTAISRFDPKTRQTDFIATDVEGNAIESKRTTTFFRDSKQRLWMCGEEGISTYVESGDGLKRCPVLPENSVLLHSFVNSIYEAHDGVFWISTRDGMYRFDERHGRLTQYTTAQGLANNVVHGILEDSYGKLWISTNRGLSCFRPQDESFRNYTDDDGLQSNQFNNNAFCRACNGQMYFGGINGITTFHPDKLVDNPYIPPVVITGLRLFNRPVRPNDGTGILQKSISQTRSITLKAGHKMFSLEFIVSNYIAGTHNTFAYKLEGYDKEWYRLDASHTASYSNLPSGTYRFLVKAANNDGKWNETPTELEIIVLPVWYRTWWAMSLFFVLFVGAVAFVIRYFWIRKSMEAHLQMERIDKQRQAEMNEMKVRFFINISHELRTPLTLILAPVQDMLEKVNDRWMRRQLEHIQRSTNRLLHLVNQLMDYRRAELGVFSLSVRPVPLHQIVRKDFLFYERVAEQKRIDYNLQSEVEGRDILCDPSYMELIVNNLLSNAFKYTGEEKSITVTLKEEEGWLLLQVADTGSGIPLDRQKKIFERFYQGDDGHPGSGIGLSLVQRLVELHHGRIGLESEVDKGSTFSIWLPTTEDAYKPEERADRQKPQEAAVHTTNQPDFYIADAETGKEESGTPDHTQRKEQILIVEDEAEIRRYLSDELGKTYHILTACDGEEALAVLKEREIDLVLTDVMMAGMDGLQLCKRLKQNLRTCHIPVIILSAKTDLKEQLNGLQIGADDYIPKPFSLAIVATKIRNIFRTRHHVIERYAKSIEIKPEEVALNPLDEELLKKAVGIVEKHLGDADFTTDAFANEMCMSRSNLHLKLKALTGEAANEFIRKIRFNRACQLLKEGKYTVAEISTMVGYNTPSYFSTSFKKYFGCMPSEYTKK